MKACLLRRKDLNVTDTVSERWKPIPGYVGLYSVSNLGRVRSHDRECGARNGGLAIRKGRVLVACVKDGRYHAVTLTKPGAREQIAIHSLVLRAFRGPQPLDKPHTRHRDGNKANNRLTNVCYGTAQDNADDRQKHGTVLRGEANANAKLNAQKVRYIRSCALPITVLGALYGVYPATIHAARVRKTWKHVT